MEDPPATPEEYLLRTVAAACLAHGLAGAVGLFSPVTFPEFRPGIGIGVGAAGFDQSLTGSWLLKQMGCDWVKEEGFGVIGHLGGKLLPAPPPPGSEQA